MHYSWHDKSKLDDIKYCIDIFISSGSLYKKEKLLKSLLEHSFDYITEIFDYLITKNILPLDFIKEHINSVYRLSIENVKSSKLLKFIMNNLKLTKLLDVEQDKISDGYIHSNDKTLEKEVALRFVDEIELGLMRLILELREINNIENDPLGDDLYKISKLSVFEYYYNRFKLKIPFDEYGKMLMIFCSNYEITCYIIKNMPKGRETNSIIKNVWDAEKRHRSFSDKVRSLYKDYVKYIGTKNEYMLYVTQPSLKTDSNIEVPQNERLITNFNLFLNKKL